MMRGKSVEKCWHSAASSHAVRVCVCVCLSYSRLLLKPPLFCPRSDRPCKMATKQRPTADNYATAMFTTVPRWLACGVRAEKNIISSVVWIMLSSVHWLHSIGRMLGGVPNAAVRAWWREAGTGRAPLICTFIDLNMGDCKALLL